MRLPTRTHTLTLMPRCERPRTVTLAPPLLPFLWRGIALSPADYPFATRMLCDTGVLIELPIDDSGEAQWVMPMRLAPQRPANVDSKLWPAALEAGKVQLGARFDFLTAGLPAGLFERCAAAAASIGKLLVCWSSGLVLVHATW